MTICILVVGGQVDFTNGQLDTIYKLENKLTYNLIISNFTSCCNKVFKSFVEILQV